MSVSQVSVEKAYKRLEKGYNVSLKWVALPQLWAGSHLATRGCWVRADLGGTRVACWQQSLGAGYGPTPCSGPLLLALTVLALVAMATFSLY